MPCTIVSALVDLSAYETRAKNGDFYMQHCNYILSIPLPMILFVEPTRVAALWKRRRLLGLAHQTLIVPMPLTKTDLYPLLPQVIKSRQVNPVHNASASKDTPLYVLAMQCKMEWLLKAYKLNPFPCTHLLWLDLGLETVVHKVNISDLVQKCDSMTLTSHPQIEVLAMNPFSVEEVTRANYFDLMWFKVAGGLISVPWHLVATFCKHHLGRFRQLVTEDQRAPNDEQLLSHSLVTMGLDVCRLLFGDYCSLLINYVYGVQHDQCLAAKAAYDRCKSIMLEDELEILPDVSTVSTLVTCYFQDVHDITKADEFLALPVPMIVYTDELSCRHLFKYRSSALHRLTRIHLVDRRDYKLWSDKFAPSLVVQHLAIEMMLHSAQDDPFGSGHLSWIEMYDKSITSIPFKQLLHFLNRDEKRVTMTKMEHYDLAHFEDEIKLKKFYQEYRYVACRNFWQGSCKQLSKQCPRLYEIAQKHMKHGYCLGIEPVMSEFMVCYESELCISYGDYQDAIWNSRGVRQNGEYIVWKVLRSLQHKPEKIVEIGSHLLTQVAKGRLTDLREPFKAELLQMVQRANQQLQANLTVQ